MGYRCPPLPMPPPGPPPRPRRPSGAAGPSESDPGGVILYVDAEPPPSVSRRLLQIEDEQRRRPGLDGPDWMMLFWVALWLACAVVYWRK